MKNGTGRVTLLAGMIIVFGTAWYSGAAEPVREDAQDTAEPGTAAMAQEIKALRADVLRLQQTVDSMLNGELQQLRTENERLRKEIKEFSGTTGQPLPPVPMPDRALLEGLYEKKTKKNPPTPPKEVNTGTSPEADNAAQTPEKEQEGAVPAAETTAPSDNPAQTPEQEAADSQAKPDEPPATAKSPQPFSFQVVEEWGRTPEEIASAKLKASSLKGIIGLVPVDSADDDLINLGRSLHEQYAAYDNVNIEVFDDTEAAHAYRGKYVAPPKHRVLSISKHKATNRDVILLIRDEKAVMVPLTPESAPQ